MTALARAELSRYLDDRLQPANFRDGSANGLEVWGTESIELIATCPSVSQDFFEQALDKGAQALLVHHGLFWNRDPRVIYPHIGKRLKILLNREVNLYAFHLPLDAHREFGNNARLAHMLNLGDLNWDFGYYHGSAIGVCGDLDRELTLEQLAQTLGQSLDCVPQVIGPAGSAVRRVGVLSGEGGDVGSVLDCQRTGCQALVTGAVAEQTVAVARELGVGLIAAGHYNSEKSGVRALGDHLASHFSVEVIHHDVPNPV